ncbi:conserved hypothetical protein [Frankia canadensis]|uniref:SMI1/KNR4 family protein n=1 Tax=Frankia canadensis TaxID=1836972 RepID=A0A2I2KND6_9ACTN|nr:hypothetical protein [Frankia canadensis]SNQ47166.1 conserved hypothetical protein [Frankia canadensis]SOU54456.1 conserved hypothetical protein [Frankia canadensis]
MAELIPLTELPAGFNYPSEYLRVVELGLTDLEPWQIIEGRMLFSIYNTLAERFPENHLVPFARYAPNDDVVCWHPETGKIVTVDPWDRHWYSNRDYENFWAWFRQAIEDLIAFDA